VRGVVEKEVKMAGVFELCEMMCKFTWSWRRRREDA
jgi:hypothetical protein